MLYFLVSIIGILFTIFFVIGIHEAAHFFTARLLNIKVLRFSIGFGKTLWRWHDKSGTEYVIAAIPLGGYVKMLDESEGKVAKQEQHLAFNRQPFYKKFLVVAAGPTINIVCAFVLYWVIFMMGFTIVRPMIGNVIPNSLAAEAGLNANSEIIQIDGNKTPNWMGVLFNVIAHAGNNDRMIITTKNLKTNQTSSHSFNLLNWRLDGLTPDPLQSLGIVPYTPPVSLTIGHINEQSPAAKALKVGDKLIAVDGNPLKNWENLITFVTENPNKHVTVTLVRQDKALSVPLTIGTKYRYLVKPYGYLGIGPNIIWPKGYQREMKFSPLAAIPQAWQQVYDFTYFNFMLFGKIITGKVSLQSLGGPITIFETAGSAINYGLLAFMSFLAFLSISIGVINFLPIPGLDGGHMVIQVIELILQRPLSDMTLNLLYRFGFLLIILVFMQAFINDLLRL